MPTVAEYEVDQISSRFSIFGENYQPKLLVVVVQKRIFTWIFGRLPKGLDNLSTIIDHTITQKGWYDFFLVSQHVRRGMVITTHYTTLWSTTTWGVSPITCRD